MKLLLDTHMLVWMAGRPSALRAKDLAYLDLADEVVGSVISLWELRIKWQLRHPSGDRKGPMDPCDVLNWAGEHSIRLLDLTPAVAAVPLLPPLAHSDPFDELLLTQAQQGGYRLLTRDAKLASHPVALVA